LAEKLPEIVIVSMIKPNLIEGPSQRNGNLVEKMSQKIPEFAIIKKNQIERFFACEKRFDDQIPYIRIGVINKIPNGKIKK
jgi:hypothetical protein